MSDRSPNGVRLSCGAELEESQMAFYRRRLRSCFESRPCLHNRRAGGESCDGSVVLQYWRRSNSFWNWNGYRPLRDDSLNCTNLSFGLRLKFTILDAL